MRYMLGNVVVINSNLPTFGVINDIVVDRFYFALF